MTSDQHNPRGSLLDSRRDLGITAVVERNARVTAADRVVVVTDPPQRALAHAIAAGSLKKGADVVICEMPLRNHHGEEPPPAVRAAMLEATVLFCPVTKSITHTQAMRAALDNGVRAILMTAWNQEMLERPALIETDFGSQSAVCHRIGAALTRGKELRLTSPNGTDLSFSIDQRIANILTNIPEPGELAPVPDIEVNIVPVTGSANGIYVADASVPYLGIGILDEPIVCSISKGLITDICGGEQATVLIADLESHDDMNCFNIAELGIGLNPHAELTGVMLEDEGVLGTVHLGIGTSHTLGGEVIAPTHYDLLMWQPLIEIDGAVAQRGKEILA